MNTNNNNKLTKNNKVYLQEAFRSLKEDVESGLTPEELNRRYIK